MCKFNLRQTQTSAILFTSAFLWFNSQSYADQQQPLSINSPIELLNERLGSKEDYQIGSEWGKVKLTEPVDAQSVYGQVVRATGKLNSATAFYIGEYEGMFLAATNNHVCSSAWNCKGKTINFTVAGQKIKAVNWIGAWKEIDFSLLQLEPTETQKAFLRGLNGRFNFAHPVELDTELITAGHGSADNLFQSIRINQDSDCRVFSKTGDYKLMSDPDEVNTGDYQAWSFAIGCDVSHGDSGSAIFNRSTGDIVGIVWTGKIPKNAKVKDSKYLDSILGTDSPDIWTELTYAVPAQKINEVLTREIEAGKINSAYVPALQAWLAD